MRGPVPHFAPEFPRVEMTDSDPGRIATKGLFGESSTRMSGRHHNILSTTCGRAPASRGICHTTKRANGVLRLLTAHQARVRVVYEWLWTAKLKTVSDATQVVSRISFVSR